MNTYLSPKQIAEELNISPITVRSWCQRGDIPYSKFGRSVRIKSVDFQKFKEDNEI